MTGTSTAALPEREAASFAVLAGGFGLFVMIAAGLPAAFALIRGGQTSLGRFAAAGAVLGNLPFALYLCYVAAFALVHLAVGTLGEHLSPPGALLAGGLRVVAIGSSFGAASGALLWLIAVRRLHRERRR